jgi:chromosome segregation ATPase
MNTIKHLLASVWTAGAFVGGAAHCAPVQPIEASRYKNAEGVEILTSRGAPVAPSPSHAVESRTPASSAASARRSAPEDTASERERERERLNILTSELISEGRALESKRLALRSPRVAIDLSSEQQQSLRDEVERHENNVRALNREIKRVSAAANELRSSHR